MSLIETCLCSRLYGTIVSFLQQDNGKIIPGWPWYLDKCKTGIAVGRSVKLQPHLYTVQECIDVVRSQHRVANGFTMEYPCGPPKKCNCSAVFNMTGWNSHFFNGTYQLYKTCRFYKGKYLKVTQRMKVVENFQRIMKVH